MNALLGCTQHASCGSCGMEQQLPSSYLLNKMQFSVLICWRRPPRGASAAGSFLLHACFGPT
eukprot:scaffold11921_cov18-Tisochrysis_lutea.AAC.1